ncbi:MAG TPA: alpha/beta fold hydrolase [Anaerolineales bacterium]|nr:alpha/beta fold hydrolase [Anaerolineales bacterium]
MIFVGFSSLIFFAPRIASGQAGSATIQVFDRQGSQISSLTDGDTIQLAVILPENALQNAEVSFSLQGLGTSIASCPIPAGNNRCETQPFSALGWFWGAGGEPVQERVVSASVAGQPEILSAPVQVNPRPVVLVHGFSSSWEAWTNYLGSSGYLASIGISGFAVGDGQVEGVMNTGRIEAPALRTNTIAENAAILGEYIENVKTLTGAQKVDLLGHSMGGLISRYYIDRVMAEVDVAQLIMLGSPMAGSECANLPASLGLYLPAMLEIRPAYVKGVFNQQIVQRNGIPFHALAGVPLLEPIQSPCTAVPSDLVVSRESVGAIPLDLSEIGVLHVDLNTSAEVFNSYVKPLLQTPPGGYEQTIDVSVPIAETTAIQFTRVFTGHLALGETRELTIQIDPGVTVASFALFDTTRSLDVNVRGASGNEITLDPVANGFRVVDDPASLVYLGYGFNNPRPGAWVVKLLTTAATPASGADYALTARYQGGATLLAQTSQLLPPLGEPVEITAQFQLDGQTLAVDTAQAVIRAPDNSEFTLDLALDGSQYQAVFEPEQPGFYDIQVRFSGILPTGEAVERTAFLVAQVQPVETSLPERSTLAIFLVGLILGGLLLALVLAGLIWRIRRRR